MYTTVNKVLSNKLIYVKPVMVVSGATNSTVCLTNFYDYYDDFVYYFAYHRYSLLPRLLVYLINQASNIFTLCCFVECPFSHAGLIEF